MNCRRILAPWAVGLLCLVYWDGAALAQSTPPKAPTFSNPAPHKTAPLKVALAQINPKVGDFDGNLKKLKEAYLKAVSEGADILVTPELSLPGYPPGDLLTRPEMVERTNKALAELKALTVGKQTLLLVGHVAPNPAATGKPLQNVMSALGDGKVVHTQAKMLLPTYNIFDEQRHFAPATQNNVFTYKGHRIATAICEDLWCQDLQRGRQIYPVDPVDQIAKQKPDVLISLSASPYDQGKAALREQIHSDVARRVNAPLVYVNQSGATDDILFDGSSFVTDAQGHVLGRMKSFDESFGMVKLDPAAGKTEIATPAAFTKTPLSNADSVHQALVMGIRDYFKKTGQKGVVLGLSGGIDSAVVAALAVEALGKENVIGIGMPSQYSSSHSLEDAEDLAKRLGIEYHVKPIKEAFDQMRATTGPVSGLAQENMQARIRSGILLGIANDKNYIVLATGNKSELAQGFSTYGGDLLGGLMPIGDLYKTEVFDLARHINVRNGNVIPERTITKPPSAELAPGQVDSDRLPPYEVLDPMLKEYIEDGVPVDQLAHKYTALQPDKPKSWVYDTIRQFEINEFKRKQAAPILRVHKVAFGIGRRVPIAKTWDINSKPAELASNAAPAATHSAAAAPAKIDDPNLDLIKQIDSKFRSSDRYIPANTLWEESLPKIGRESMLKLAQLSREDLLKAINHAGADVGMNRGVAENLLKLQQMAKKCQDLCPISENFGDQVAGLPQKDLDALVNHLPELTGARRAGEFNLATHDLVQLAKRDILNNDLYNFKVAASYFADGLHENTKVTFSLFSRGKSNRAYMMTAGQEQVLDLLKNLHFTEKEVQYLKNKPDFKNVPEAYFDYLRNFRFKGTVRSTRPGTIEFANEPIMEVIGNPVEAQIVETLILPIMNLMSNSATKTARVVHAAAGRIVAEGGTRRGGLGTLGAIAAYIAGASGTSNSHVARITGIKDYGSQNHASIMMYDDELEAHLKFRRVFPETTLLADTHGIESGLKVAVRAGGDQFKGPRLDSTLPGKDKAETAKVAKDTLKSVGYGDRALTYSDGLDEYELDHIKKAPFDIALVGTEIQSPSDTNGLGMVYKLTEIQRDGRIIDPVKQSTGKQSIPGQKQIYRLQKNGKFSQDIIAEHGEAAPPGAKPLLEEVMRDGEILKPRESLQAQQAWTRAQMKQMPSELMDVHAKAGGYPVKISDKLQARTQKAIAANTPVKKLKVGVFVGSFDPPTDSHILTAERAKALYNLDEMIIVPTGSAPVHGKVYQFTPQQRVAMLKDRFKKDPGIKIYTGEVEGKTRFTTDTLKDIQSGLPADHEMYVVAGEDVFETLPKWKDADRLLNEYNWIVPARGGKGYLDIPASLIPNHRQLDNRHFVSQTGKRIEWVDLRLPPLSSTQVRERLAGVDAVFHEVDVQQTFWEGMHGQVDGPLAIKGTREITKNVADLKRLAHASQNIKVVASVDRHYQVEVKNPKVNPEFHPDPASGFPGFAPHAMAGKAGPVGPARIPEAEVFSKEEQLMIPHNRPAGDALKLKPFDMDAVSDRILDPNVEVVLEKNGPGSFSVFENPRAQEVYDRLQPKKIYVYGVATDFCVKCAVQELRTRYPNTELYIVKDAIAGVFDHGTEAALKEMQEAGAKLVTTDEVFTTHFPKQAQLRWPKGSKALNSRSACMMHGMAQMLEP